MAELEARFEKDESKGWRRPLPEDVEVKLGRAPGPEGLAADWDGFISSVHAHLLWKDGKLQVRRRTLPKPTLNPIYYKAVEADEFSLSPGERFVIGGTVFTLLAEEPPAPDPTPDSAATNPQLTQMVYSRQQLREVRFVDADRRIEALAALPEIIRFSPSDADLEQRVVRVLLEGIPTANAAAVVCCLPGGESDRKVAVRCAEGRDGEIETMAPSRKLIYEAIRHRREGVLHVWDRTKPPTEESGYSLQDPSTDWAICIPLPDDPTPGWGLYITGGVERRLSSADSIANDMQLQCDLKFSELAADIFGALRRVHHLQHQKSVLSTFLSEQVRIVLENRNIDEVLERREVEATVLFCDLQGFTRKVEEGQGDLMGLWDNVSEALGVMTEAITHEGGVIGDFQGDAAMAFWGWPLAGDDQETRAARAALAIRRRFAKAARTPGHRLAGFACGLGLAHGPAIAGRIGTLDQFKVGVFGPVVNRAARLEALTRRFKVSILVDEAAADRLGNGDGWRRRRVARLQPYGMKEPLMVSELLPPAVESGPGSLSEAQRLDYEAALEAFMAGRWKDAYRHLKYLGGDGPSDYLMNYLKQHPEGPPEGWDGAIRMESK